MYDKLVKTHERVLLYKIEVTKVVDANLRLENMPHASVRHSRSLGLVLKDKPKMSVEFGIKAYIM